MPRYSVKARYDMGMSMGGETYFFEAADDKAAIAYLKQAEGCWLSPIKRDIHFDFSTLGRLMESEKTGSAKQDSQHDHSKVIHGRSHQTDIYPDGCHVNP